MTTQFDQLFATISVSDETVQKTNKARSYFEHLALSLANLSAKTDTHEFSIVKTKLEEACFYAVKNLCLYEN